MSWWLGHIDEARRSDAIDNDDLMSGAAWSAFCDLLEQAGAIVLRPDVPATQLDRAEGFRHLMALLQIGISQALARPDPRHPSFGQVSRTDVFKWGMDCPDAAYQGTPISGELTYRVRGTPGSARYLSFQLNAGMQTLANLRGDELSLGPDGSFELLIGPQPDHRNTIRTTADADTLILRQFFSDWDTERPARVSIEVLDGARHGGDSNAPTPDRVARQLCSVGEWLQANAAFFTDIEVAGQASPNRFDPPSVKTEMGGAQENVSAFGHYRLGPDDALIVSLEPPRARYWSIHLGNFWWESLDYAGHQTSINDHQAVVDSDGVFRAVVAHRDPGVANWLDTMGHASGPMLVRYVVTESVPQPATQVVPVGELRRHLPPGTTTVDAATRAALIGRRRTQVLRRFAT